MSKVSPNAFERYDYYMDPAELAESDRRWKRAGHVVMAVALGGASLFGVHRHLTSDDRTADKVFAEDRIGAYIAQPGDTVSDLGKYVEAEHDGVAGDEDYRPFSSRISDQAPNGLVSGETVVQLPVDLDQNPEQPGVQLPPPSERG